MAVDPVTAAQIGSTIGKSLGLFDGLFGGGNPAHQTSLVNVGFDGRLQSGGGKLGNAPGHSLAKAITDEFARFGAALGIKPIGSDSKGITVRVLGNPNAGDRSGQSAYTVFAGPKQAAINTDNLSEAVSRGAVANLKRNDGTAIFGAAIPKPARAAIKASSATTIDGLLADVSKALKPPVTRSTGAKTPNAPQAKPATGNAAQARAAVATNDQIRKALAASPIRAALPPVLADQTGGDPVNLTPLLLAAVVFYFGGV